jgi:serine acetyltransferase
VVGIPSLLFGVELPVSAKIGPRLRLYHPHGIVLNPNCTLGSGDLHVGDHARVGALAVVLDAVPAWGIVVGNPGRVIRIDDRAVQR